jgi:peroxiredoxin
MRTWLSVVFAVAAVSGQSDGEEPVRQAPKIVLKSTDGKKSYDLAKLVAEGPVLVRLTCACSGCDQELPYFQRLQAAYESKGLRTLAVFQEKPEAANAYVERKDVKFLWIADPEGGLWKSFDTKAMPTNILIAKGGRIVKILPGCTKDGRNAQTLSAEVATLLKTDVARVAEDGAQKKRGR